MFFSILIYQIEAFSIRFQETESKIPKMPGARTLKFHFLKIAAGNFDPLDSDFWDLIEKLFNLVVTPQNRKKRVFIHILKPCHIYLERKLGKFVVFNSLKSLVLRQIFIRFKRFLNVIVLYFFGPKMCMKLLYIYKHPYVKIWNFLIKSHRRLDTVFKMVWYWTMFVC